MKFQIMSATTLSGRRTRVVMKIPESEKDRKQLEREQKESGLPVIEGFAPEGAERGR